VFNRFSITNQLIKHGGEKEMRKENIVKLFIVIAITAMLSTAIGAQFVAQASAAVTVQQITSALGGADYLIRIPSNWQGDLIVFCRGYSHSLSEVNLVTWANMWNGLINNGFAYAASNYGAGGFSVKEGVIRTHQLTEYVINNYHVTGKVFLVGGSMGGNIVLELGAKYPDLYDGVIDMFGSKDLAAQYNNVMCYAGIADDDDLAAAVIANGGVNPPFPCNSIAAFRDFCLNAGTDIALACGSTPEEKPKAYERFSPMFSATNIAIPTITLHGTADSVVPYHQSVEFKDAVATAGHANLYRLYTVTGGQHGDPSMLAKMSTCVMLLINWVKNGVPAPQVQPWPT
jgi:predicted esterase